LERSPKTNTGDGNKMINMSTVSKTRLIAIAKILGAHLKLT
jgi:hypothetical protein